MPGSQKEAAAVAEEEAVEREAAAQARAAKRRDELAQTQAEQRDGGSGEEALELVVAAEPETPLLKQSGIPEMVPPASARLELPELPSGWSDFTSCSGFRACGASGLTLVEVRDSPATPPPPPLPPPRPLPPLPPPLPPRAPRSSAAARQHVLR